VEKRQSIERLKDVVTDALEPWNGSTVVVAVSGGSDSVGLLRLLHTVSPQLRIELAVAHLNHTVRGAAADDDARFVAKLAALLSLPFEHGTWIPSTPQHFEANARRARYDWLRKVAESQGASAVAVGHTRDDQAETIMHRIVRGTGLRGLAGMATRRPLGGRVTLVRPLLTVTRSDIQAYLASIGQDFRTDVTNTDTSRTRARIRHDLLPKLAEDYNPKVAGALVRLGELAAHSQSALERRIRGLERKATHTRTPSATVLDRRVLLALDRHSRAEVLRRVWQRQGWPERSMSADHWTRLAARVELMSDDWSPGAGLRVRVTPDSVELTTANSNPASPSGSVSVPVPGTAQWGGGTISLALDATNTYDELVDFDALRMPLMVRAPEPGDRFDPLGMHGKTQSVNDLLRGRDVPRSARCQVPILLDAAGIIWVAGHRISHRVRRTESTHRTLGLRWEPAPGLGLEARQEN
jgi:tRNA(Ile)-lysidine synthase